MHTRSRGNNEALDLCILSFFKHISLFSPLIYEMGRKYIKFAKQHGRKLVGAAYGAGKAYQKFKSGKYANKSARKSKLRISGSKTFVQKKPGNSNTNTTVARGPGSSSFNKVSYKKQKTGQFVKLIGNVSTYDDVETGYSIAADGLQNVTDSPQWMFDTPQIGALFNAAARFYDSLAGVYTEQAYNTTTSRSKKLWLDSQQQEYRWVNQAPSACELEFYILMCKATDNISTGPATQWENGLDTIAMGTTTNNTVPYCQPYVSKIFTKSYKTVFKKKVILMPGAIHTHKFKFNCGRMIDTAYAYDNQRIKGITYVMMYVTRGVPADTSKTKSVGDITLTQTKVLLVQRSCSKVRLISAFPRNYVQTSNLDVTNTAIYVPGVGGDEPVDAELDAEFA